MMWMLVLTFERIIREHGKDNENEERHKANAREGVECWFDEISRGLFEQCFSNRI